MRSIAYADRRAPNVEFRPGVAANDGGSCNDHTKGVIMNRTGQLSIRLAMLATAVVGLGLGTTGRATAATCVVPSNANRVPCPTKLGARWDGATMAPAQQMTDNSDRTLQWVLLAAAVLGALAILAVASDVLARRRWRQPPLETALATSDPEELPRVAGLLGERFAQQDRTDAAEHAYRAAIGAGDERWSPVAQVALADLLSDRGERSEAKTLLESAITSGHPRAVPAAQAGLDQLRTGNSPTPEYETLEATASASRRTRVVPSRRVWSASTSS
jgi:predicted negative regulator of RcsB-dependent stress response